MATCIENNALALQDRCPLSLPSPARGEGFKSPSLDGRGKEEGGFGPKVDTSCYK